MISRRTGRSLLASYWTRYTSSSGLLDTDGTTLEINRAALEGAGIQFGDIKGKPFWEARWWAVSKGTQDLQRDLVRRAREGKFVRCEVEIYGHAAGDETIVIDAGADSRSSGIHARHGDNLTESCGPEPIRGFRTV